MVMAMLGGMFGINGDGKLGCADKVVGYSVVHTPMGRRGRKGLGAQFFAREAYAVCRAQKEEQDEIFAEVGRSVNLIIAGLNEQELRNMDTFQRREALEDAGLDPDLCDSWDI